jgi:hypothetical protein
MVAGPATGAAPRRYGSSGRALYTDPFAEMQGVTKPSDATQRPSMELFPPVGPSTIPAFPVIDTPSDDTSFALPAPDTTQLPSTHLYAPPIEERPIDEASTAPAVTTPPPYIPVDSSLQKHPTPIYDPTPIQPVARLDQTEDPSGFADLSVINRLGSGALQSRNSLEMSGWFAEQPVHETHQETTYTHHTHTETYSGETEATTYSETTRVDISILGHPLPEGPLTFPSTGRINVNDLIRSSSAEQLQRAISDCALVVRNDPSNRALFCEAMEEVTFAEGRMRQTAAEAVPILVSCLEESLEYEDDPERSLLNRSSVASAIGALWNLHDEEVGLSTENIISVAKRAMDAFPNDAQVQCNSVGLLIQITANAPSGVVSQGCLSSLVAAVEAHPNNDELLEQVCQVLAMIAARKDLKDQLPLQYCRTVADIAHGTSDPAVTRWVNWLERLIV